MGKIAFVLSGQGAQCAGMGKSFYDEFPTVHTLFDEAEAYRPGTLNQSFQGTDEELKQTENTQPCLYLADLAAALALTECGVKPEAVAGFSLGEIPALAYAGAFSYLEGFKIACVRGAEMGKADPAAMVAAIKLDDEAVIRAVADIDGAWAVNFNSPGQVVVSCRAEKLNEVTAKLKEAGARVMPLKTSGGFHSPLMENAAGNFAAALESMPIHMPELTVYADRTASVYAENPKIELPRQMVSPVLWSKLITNMAGDGYDTFIETGVGTTLTGFIRRILPEAKVYSVTNAEEARKVSGELTHA